MDPFCIEDLFQMTTLAMPAEPARMVVYPGGSHALAGTGRPSHRLDYHRRLAHWVRGQDR